jgi:hypothetical protein
VFGIFPDALAAPDAHVPLVVALIGGVMGAMVEILDRYR